MESPPSCGAETSSLERSGKEASRLTSEVPNCTEQRLPIAPDAHIGKQYALITCIIFIAHFSDFSRNRLQKPHKPTEL